MEAVAAGAVTERKPDDGEALARCRRREGALGGVTWKRFRQASAEDSLGSVTSVYRHFPHLIHFDVRLSALWRVDNSLHSLRNEPLSVSQANPFLTMPTPQANISFLANSSSLKPTFLDLPLPRASLNFSVPQAGSSLVPCKLTYVRRTTPVVF